MALPFPQYDRDIDHPFPAPNNPEKPFDFVGNVDIPVVPLAEPDPSIIVFRDIIGEAVDQPALGSDTSAPWVVTPTPEAPVVEAPVEAPEPEPVVETPVAAPAPIVNPAPEAPAAPAAETPAETPVETPKTATKAAPKTAAK
jgi:hypothetical protein